MTERGPLTGVGGAPNPAEPSHSGDATAPAARPPSALPAADLAAVRATDALVESLAARRVPGAGARPADDADPAARLLRALITDVDDQAAGPAPPGPGPGPRRRGPRTIVALGVAGAVLASTGVAAAGGGAVDRTSAARAPSSSGTSGPPGGRVPADVDAGTHDRPGSSVRPAQEPAARRPSRDLEREDIGRLKRRLAHLLPPRDRRDRPDVPTGITRKTPSARPDARPDDDALRRLDALRREAQKRANRYENPDWDG
ncbi:hypothetical protein [Actinomadura sp. GTD37]|uniref:hypothetical protein n=1 Tax=Actinomadura sp. GTD37 TaxID=1778030 RepID=UPI0035C0F485